MAGYKKRVSQQYAVKRKKVLSKVEAKLKKVKKKKVTPAAIEAPAPASPVKALPPGRKAKLRFKSGTVSITANVRYETEKVDPLIKIVYVADGEIVHKKFIGPKKRVAWVDDKGKEHDAKDVQQMQQLEDGSLIPIKITKTKDIEVEPVPAKIMDEFHPYSYLEVWGENEGDVEALKDLAFELKTKGQVGAVKKFSHGYGKIYVGFIRPVISKDGKSFTLEMMLSENKKRHRRWMPTETEAKKMKPEEPKVPELW